MKIKLSLLLMLILPFIGYPQIGFENNVVIDNRNATNNPQSVFTADIDGDGDMDILSASSADSKIAWYENLDGQGIYGNQQVISIEAIGATSVIATDIDGDGDMDVASASYFDNKIAWYENLDGQGNFGNQIIITTEAFVASSVFAADIDGDGDMDVISSSGNINEGKIAWYENTDGIGNFGLQNIINSSAVGATSVYAADIDNDGDVDVLSTAGLSNGLVWYENIDSQGQFGTEKIINANNGTTNNVKVGDIDNDGDNDVISVSSGIGTGPIAWYENLDGLGNFGTQKIISSTEYSAYDIFLLDIDGDENLDVIAARGIADNSPSIEWYKNLDGLGTFGDPQLVQTTSGFTSSIFVADVDNNGSADIVSASEDRIGYNKNLGNGNFGPHQYFTYNVYAPQKVYTSDLDGDGNLDVLSASSLDGEIAWYRNMDGHGNFGVQQTISQNNWEAKTVVAKDIDGDGDMDIVFASQYHVAWQENIDGNGNFGPKRIIIERVGNAFFDVAAEDIDNDGDMDVVVADFFVQELAWFENLDGQGNFGAEQIIEDDFGFAVVGINVVDINNDGNLDVLSASLNEGEANWHENLGAGNFAPPHLITSSFNNNIDFVHAADLDGDNDLDVTITKRIDGKVVWFENLDGFGNFGTEQVITSLVELPRTVYSADVDNDGDLDMLSASFEDNKIAWYENVDGLGNFGPQQIIMANANGANSVIATDLDADGDIDIIASLTQANEIRWFKNNLILGINEIDTLEFSIYPNPSSNILNINSQKSIQKIEVFNNLGQLVTNNIETLGDENSQLNVSKLANGIYFIKIKTFDGKIGVERFIKK